MDGWIDGWMDEWMDRWMDGWIDGWIDRLFDFHLFLVIPISLVQYRWSSLLAYGVLFH